MGVDCNRRKTDQRITTKQQTNKNTQNQNKNETNKQIQNNNNRSLIVLNNKGFGPNATNCIIDVYNNRITNTVYRIVCFFPRVNSKWR